MQVMPPHDAGLTRTIILGVAIIALVLAVGLMNIFGSGYDFKLSGP